MNPYMSKPKTSSVIEIPDHVLKRLLTASEVRMLKNRWQIIQLLEEGLSIRKIASEVQVGTDTVVRVARMIEKGELQKLLDDERKAFAKKIKTNTPWIFGKSE